MAHNRETLGFNSILLLPDRNSKPLKTFKRESKGTATAISIFFVIYIYLFILVYIFLKDMYKRNYISMQV